MKKTLLCLIVFIFIFTSCAQQPTKDIKQDETTEVNPPQGTPIVETTAEVTQPETTNTDNDTPAAVATNTPTTDAEIIDFAKEILEVIKNEDYTQLATYVSDTYKLGLSPYSNADFSTLVYFTTADIIAIPTSTTPLTWGIQDGSGEPIVMKPLDYFHKYVYDQDFLAAPQVALDQVIGTGTMINNTTTAPNSDHYVEFHFPSFDPQYDGMDWESLRLAFHVDASGTFYLVYIIHDSWTI